MDLDLELDTCTWIWICEIGSGSGPSCEPRKAWAPPTHRTVSVNIFSRVSSMACSSAVSLWA